MMKKRAFSFVLALAMCLGLAGTALADGENTDTVLPFLKVTQSDGKIENCDLVEDSAGSGWAWTAATQTMTLNNFNGGDIYFDGNYGSDLKITICQSGTNTVDGTIGFLKVKGTLDFTGEGSLTVTGELKSVEAITLWSGKLLVAEKENDYKGIYCPVTVNGGELENRAERPSTALTLNGGLVKLSGGKGVSVNETIVFNGGSLSVDAILHDIAYQENITGNYSVTMADGMPGDDVPPGDRLYPVLFTSTGTGAPPAPSVQVNTVPSELSATPTSATVLVNGQNIAFDAYNIGGANFFKLRDLAYVLTGTEKQFEVSYDTATKNIALLSGQTYTAVGGELAASSVTGAQNAATTPSTILLDGQEISLTAYLINGSNYFMLRDIGQLFDFGIGWDAASRTITIDTSTGYTAG